MMDSYIVGLDNGGTTNNATVLDRSGRFLVDRMVEIPSRVREGPPAAIEALAEAYDHVLTLTGVDPAAVVGVGLDTPGPASADGVVSSLGSTNFAHPDWCGFDIRAGLAARLGLPVVYLNDGNAAALYAHHTYFGTAASQHSSVSAIVGTGLGGGIIESGLVIKGASGMAGELGHVEIPTAGLLADDQPVPRCACGLAGDVESFVSLTGIEKNLLPYWLTKHPGHRLQGLPPGEAAKLVRGLGEDGDLLALSVFGQQAAALGRLFGIVANVTDPAAYFVGGGVVETGPAFRDWYLDQVRSHTRLRAEQAARVTFALVPERDMAGARGSALAARAALGFPVPVAPLIA